MTTLSPYLFHFNMASVHGPVQSRMTLLHGKARQQETDPACCAWRPALVVYGCTAAPPVYGDWPLVV